MGFPPKPLRILTLLMSFFAIVAVTVPSFAQTSSTLLKSPSGNFGIGTTMTVGGLSVMAGNVGFGTWSPTAALQVVGTVSATSFVGDGSGLSGISAGGWTDGGPNVYTAVTTDNVGIGTTTPTSTLEVVKTAAGTAPLMVSTVATGDGNILIVNSAGQVGIGTTLMSPASGTSIMNGYVGIGTWSPREFLEVSGTSAGGQPYIRMALNNPASDNGTSFRYYNGATLGAAIVYNNTDGQFELNASSANSYTTMQTAGVERVRITSTGAVGMGTALPVGGTAIMNGNVGIGTWSPQQQMAIVGNVGVGTIGTSPYIRTTPTRGGTLQVESAVGIGTTLTAASTGLAVMSGNVGIGTWNLSGNSGALIVASGAGNVGIGTIRPGAALDVNGRVRSTTGGFQLPDGTIIDDSGDLGGAANVGWTDGGTNVYVSTTTDNVGIGTTTPSSTFEIVKTGTVPAFMLSSVATSDGDYLFVASGGMVGIGTNSPTDEFEVVNLTANTDVNFVSNSKTDLTIAADRNNNGTDDAEITFDSGATSRFAIGYDKSAGGFGIVAGSTLGDTAALFITSGGLGNVGIATIYPVNGTAIMNGNVGIGTWSPQQQLALVGNVGVGTIGTSPYLRTAPIRAGTLQIESAVGIGTTLTAASTGLAVMSGNVGIGTWNLSGNSGALIVASGAGNVGIGTIRPGAVLDVNGRVRSTTGGFQLPDGTIIDDSGDLGGAANVGWTDGGTNVYVSTTTDNVGIGTTTPSTTLEIVKQSSNAPLMVSSVPTGDGDFLKIDSAGNIGISSINPESRFVIRDNGTAGTYVLTIHADDQNPYLAGFFNDSYSTTTALASYFGYNTAGAGARVGVVPGDFSMGTDTARAMHFYTNTYQNVRMTIDANGNVGIGTIYPSAGLSVMNGNVGIGTWNPTAILQIKGLNCSSNANGGALTTDSNGNVSCTDDDSGGSSSGWTDGGTNVYTSTTTDTVGIGTTTPAANTTFEIVKQGTNFLMKLSNAANGTGNIMTIPSSGNVGIGTNLPLGGLTVMNGNVGMGTWLPSQNLEIVSDNLARYSLKLRNRNSTAAGSIMEFVSTNGSTTRTWIAGSGIWGIGQDTFVISPDNSEGATNPFVITLGGNVGVGTYTPSSKMVVNGGLGIGTTGASSFITNRAPDGGLIVEKSVGIGTTLMPSTTGLSVMNGNVGIGTWSPRAALEVKGGAVTFSSEYDEGSETGAFTVNWNNGNKQKVTITGTGLDVTFTDPPGATNLVLRVVQGDGSDTIDWANETSIKWAGASSPTLSTASGAEDIVSCYFNGTTYYCVPSLNFQ